MQPKFDPLYYVMRPKHGKWTRMRAASAALDASMLTLDEYLDWMDSILNH